MHRLENIFLMCHAHSVSNEDLALQAHSRSLHPCLVSYEDLPENEKEYDRNTAMETLKLIEKLEFRIEK